MAEATPSDIASQKLILTCGGAYIKLSGGNIDLGAPGNILLNATNVQKMGAASLNTPATIFPKGYSEGFTLRDPESGEIKPFIKYKITTGEGEVFEGVTGENGLATNISTVSPMPLNIEFPGEKKVTSLFWTYGENEIPVSDISRRYSDLNLHAKTENYQPGDNVDIEIDMGNGIRKTIIAEVGLDGIAVSRNFFSNNVISLNDEV